MAFDKGLMDLFPLNVGTPDNATMKPSGLTATTGLTMGYYDGNTVTAPVELRAALRDERQLVQRPTSARRPSARST